MGTKLLEVVKLTKRFGAFVAVNEVSFDVHEGEVLGIAGPNGSGKSTLFNIMTGIPFPPDGGEVRFNDRTISRLKAFEIARLGLVRTFQKDSEFKSLTTRENVHVAIHKSLSMDPLQKSNAIELALDQVEFEEGRRNFLVGDLSVFDKKRLMIATALVSKPKILMLDEPASGLTKPEIDALRELLLNLNESGLTIIVIEHVLSLLMAVAQRLIVLDAGRILSQGNPQVVVKDQAVISAYLGGQAHHATAA